MRIHCLPLRLPPLRLLQCVGLVLSALALGPPAATAQPLGTATDDVVRATTTTVGDAASATTTPSQYPGAHAQGSDPTTGIGVSIGVFIMIVIGIIAYSKTRRSQASSEAASDVAGEGGTGHANDEGAHGIAVSSASPAPPHNPEASNTPTTPQPAARRNARHSNGPAKRLTQRQFKLLPQQYDTEKFALAQAREMTESGGHADEKAVQDECAICLDEYLPEQPVTRLPCFHTFHQMCIRKWLTKRSIECPVCKSPVIVDPE